jgi:Ca2+-transporting ATPase
MHSEIGRVGRSLSGIETEITPLQRRVRALVKTLSVAGLALSGAAALLYWFTRGDWLGGLLAGITLAMALLPEELPLILTVFMAMGSWRLSRQRVLTRRAAAIETLGSATVLCTDKTGTLTVNRMRVVALVVPEEGQKAVARHWAVGQPLDDAALTALLETGVLASQPQPVDPMERAFHDLAAQHAPQVLQTVQSGELTHAYGLSRELLAMTHVWRLADRAQIVVAAKGAPEAIIGRRRPRRPARRSTHSPDAASACWAWPVPKAHPAARLRRAPPHKRGSPFASWAWWVWLIRCATRSPRRCGCAGRPAYAWP